MSLHNLYEYKPKKEPQMIIISYLIIFVFTFILSSCIFILHYYHHYDGVP